jgi:nitroimidazol reductase NimA-like FMN-containing flavoprotein (pyridoxamine 5'-phosphate oxidase superfamily)
MADSELSASGLEVLSQQKCRELLATRDVGRLAFAGAGEVEIFPVNYAVDGSTIVFRIAESTRLMDALKTRVAFEVDDWNPAKGFAWSVVVKGVAEELTDAIDSVATALRRQHVVPLAPGRRERWIAIYPSAVTGRWFRLG